METKTEKKQAIHLSDRESNCLRAWDGIGVDHCLNFRGVGNRCGVEPHNIRRVVRSLARKGLLYFQRGLFDECDGTAAGSGYGLTQAGADHLAALASLQIQEQSDACASGVSD